jgi:hypothetical protein
MIESESEAEERTDLQITVCPNGVVNVRNPEYDRGHTYSVILDDDGSVVRCSCKGWKYHNHCYHADEVESRPLITSSAESLAESYERVASDGGLPAITHHTEPEEVSGQPYSRCEGCGSESVEDSCGDTSILHNEDCLYVSEGNDSTTDGSRSDHQSPRRDDSDETDVLDMDDSERGVVEAYPDGEQLDELPPL